MSYNYKKCNNIRKNNIQSPIMGLCNMMPVPTGAPWNVHDMPWSSNIPNSRVMEFNAVQNNCGPKIIHHKRKSELEPAIPSKQHISEEKMAAHFNNLHISLDYPTDSVTYDNYDMDSMTNNNDTINVDFETRLKNAQKIVLCEEMRQLKNEPIVPLSLLNSLERPCKAVVLWQPPPTLDIRNINSLEQSEEREQDNNNCCSVDLNSMEVEMDV